MPTAPRSAVRVPDPLDFPRPLASVDIALFSVIAEVLQVLLVRRRRARGETHGGRWALPGGFVDVTRDASLEACARRKLLEKTGDTPPYLEQLGAWGDARRDPRGWSLTAVYFALVDPGRALAAGGNAEDVAWHPVAPDVRPGPLAFDHDRLLDAALARLRAKVEYTMLPAGLMPDVFTLPGLQRTFEVVLGRPLDKSAFRTRVLAAGVVAPTGGFERGSRRPAALYRLVGRPDTAMPGTFRRPDRDPRD